MDHAKLLDVLTSLAVSQSILPRDLYFATSRPANHAICIFIDSNGYPSWPIRRRLFIDYIIMVLIAYKKNIRSYSVDRIYRFFSEILLLPYLMYVSNKCSGLAVLYLKSHVLVEVLYCIWASMRDHLHVLIASDQVRLKQAVSAPEAT